MYYPYYLMLCSHTHTPHIGVDGAIALKQACPTNDSNTNTSGVLKQLHFEGNALPEVKDLCKVAMDAIESVQPELQIENKILAKKNSKFNTMRAHTVRALSFQNLLTAGLKL